MTILILATFLLAGWVNGVIGLGLPTISLALLIPGTFIVARSLGAWQGNRGP